jgi:hypothetical protein
MTLRERLAATLGVPADTTEDDLLDLAQILTATTTYRTIEGVELITVGMEWPAHPEPATLTLEHLVDAMVAANDDPHIRRPRVKLGHVRWQPGHPEGFGDHDPTWDGMPAFGTATNLRLANDGAKLVCDLVEVPEWLAVAMPSAWPNRSCEWLWDVQTEGGKRYSLVITAVGLLGEQQHAIKDLADLTRLLVQGPDNSED